MTVALRQASDPDQPRTLGNANSLAGLSFLLSSHRSTIWLVNQTLHPTSAPPVSALFLVRMGPGNPVPIPPHISLWAGAWKYCVRQHKLHSSAVCTISRNTVLGNTSLTRTQLVLQRHNQLLMYRSDYTECENEYTGYSELCKYS